MRGRGWRGCADQLKAGRTELAGQTEAVAVDAVVFDFFGTLTPGRRAEAQTAARHEQAAALGVDPAEYDRILTGTYRERFRGATGGVEESLAWAAARVGVTPSPQTLALAATVRLRTERRFAETRPEVLPLLRQLRADGLRVGLISDCTAELPLVYAELPIASLIDAAVFSCLTGQVKPDPDNYLTCCSRLGVDPSRCVYVGDGGSDELAGAARVGMRSVHLDVPDERGAVAYGRHAAWGGDVIESLSDLPTLIQEIEAHFRTIHQA
jgi:putative hydrolase of the HAD superfamily